MAQKSKSDIHVDWTTVTYRSVILSILAVLSAATVALHFAFPAQSQRVESKAQNYIISWIGSKVPADANAAQELQQAHFTNIDGTVRVKKVNSNTWVKADYGLPLEQGDVVQTMSEGIAKIAFADGSTYNIQQDSLITIEENTTNAAQQQQIAVRVNTGNIILNTGITPSTQQVKIDQTTTTVDQDSALQASNKGNKPEVMLTKGHAKFKMGDEVAKMAPFEKVAFNPQGQTYVMEKEIAPPVLLAPANMMPVFVQTPVKPVDFSWSPVENAKSYYIRLSKNSYFSSVEKEGRVEDAAWKVSGLSEGRYYWVVQSVDAKGHESIASEKNGFTIITKGKESISMGLDLDEFIQHGHVIEVKGRTEQGARVMVNGEQVPVIGDDGTFNYFTPPLPTGESMITITAQNEKGGVNTQTKRIVIQ